ncbi:MAG TPA: hypothetical protein ENK06_00110 [Gammaproteobacteria bacterium]|nr:hypothetical protein [Gammaproteobacteria bacterium]
MAIATRSLEESLDMTNSQGRWVNALRDMAILGAAITVYFAAGNMVNEFFSATYSYFEKIGSVGSITNQLADTIEQLEAKTQDTGTLSYLAGSVWNFAGTIVYYASLIAVTTLIAFLHLAQALGYGLCFCWGLIAIPMSITRNFRLLKGWAMFTAFILMWPVVESLTMGLISSIFADMGQTMTGSASGNTDLDQGAVMMMYTTLNIILFMIAVVAPFVTNALVSNAPAGKDFVVPFIAGAMANVAAMNAVNTKAAGPIASGAGSVGKAVGGGIIDRVGAEANYIKSAFRSQPSSVVNSEFSELKTTTTSSSTSGNSAPTDPAARQARRGAIINQNKNKAS